MSATEKHSREGRGGGRAALTAKRGWSEKLHWEGIFEQGLRGAGHQPAGVKRKGTWASASRTATLR